MLTADGRNRSESSIATGRSASPAPSPAPSASAASTDPASLVQENESLVARLAEAQTRGWDLEEQLKVAKMRTRNQEEELRTKTDVIRQYMLREFAGELKPLSPHVAATLALASDNSSIAQALTDASGANVSPMKAVQASAGATASPARAGKGGKSKAAPPDPTVLLQVNSRLQSVLEDLMTKNTRLQVCTRRMSPTRARAAVLVFSRRMRGRPG
jgi:hypothetical protein